MEDRNYFKIMYTIEVGIVLCMKQRTNYQYKHYIYKHKYAYKSQSRMHTLMDDVSTGDHLRGRHPRCEGSTFSSQHWPGRFSLFIFRENSYCLA